MVRARFQDPLASWLPYCRMRSLFLTGGGSHLRGLPFLIEGGSAYPKPLAARSNRVRRARVLPMREIAPGLWRWTAPHPAWRPGAERDSPGDWDESVGSVLYLGRDAAVFIDPLLPHDEEQFWRWADERVAGRGVVVLTTLLPHRRSREQVIQRYGASSSRVKRNLPAGVESIVLRGARETMFWLPEHRTLVPGDRILGAPGGGLMLCPESRLYWVRVNRDELRMLLQPLLDLPIERVLVSHGEPVLSGGGEALRRCLSS